LKAITKNTKIVTFCNISNVFAYNIDINKITEKIKEINKNIIIVIDATQSIPHMKIDTKKANIDYLVFSGHKMLGPTGIGVLYCNKKHLLTTEPLRLGGGMNTNVTKNSFTFANAPDKFEGGTHNIAGIIGLNAAINFINRIGIENIEEHEMKLKNYINKKFSEIKNIEFYNSFAKFPICIFNMKGIYPQDLASFLAHNKIIVRSGTMCAKLQHNISNNEVGYVRASFYLYNDEKDVDKLVKLLKNFKKGDILKHVIK
jgi:cysteine desulfurase/selenocysteine lyase